MDEAQSFAKRLPRVRMGVLALGLAAFFGLVELAPAQQEQRPRLQLSERIFEDQQALWRRTVASLVFERPGVVDVYGLVFSPFDDGDVFLRESNMVAKLLADSLSPSELRRALDQAGIRNRVIAVSACYSGGWVGPLASDTTLIMTAADAHHTSYGCGRLSELTFFGRALFHEQLRKTHSFERAFAAAVPVIRQREIEARKDDGFSNPQIRVGAGIRPVLRDLELRLAMPRPPG